MMTVSLMHVVLQTPYMCLSKPENQLTPTPVMDGLLANSPYFTDPIVQFTSGSQLYFCLHSSTLVAVPIFG